MHLHTPFFLLTSLLSLGLHPTTATPTPAPPHTSHTSHGSHGSQGSLTARAATCNGHASLCDKSYGNVTFVGTHNSYAVGGEVADNQGWNVSRQLDDGIRLLQVQTHLISSTISLCHSSCSLQSSGPLTTYLTTLSTWLTANPTEVVTLLITNPESLAPATFAADFVSAGLDTLAFVPSGSTVARDEWPTLGTMVDSGKRLVVFMDYGADFSAAPYIMDEFSNVFEDAYDTTSQDFSCAANRTSGSPETTLMLTNHYLDYTTTLFNIPLFLSDKSKITTTNAASGYGSLGQGISNCVDRWARNPNFVLLDWYDSNGAVPFVVAAQLNGVAEPTNTVITSQYSTNSTAGSSSSASASVTAKSTGTAAATGGTTSSAISASGRSFGVGAGLFGLTTAAITLMCI